MDGGPLQGERKYSNPFVSMLKMGAGLAPIGLAGATVFGRVRSNDAINPVSAITGKNNKLSSVITEASAKAASTLHTDKTARLNSAKATAEKIMQADEVQKLLSSVSETNAVVSSMLDFLQDPSNGLDQQYLMSYKQKMVEILNKSADQGTAKETIQGVMAAIINGSSDDAKLRWEDNLRQYRNVRSQLTPPKPFGSATKGYSVLEASNLQGPASKRYEELLGIVGEGARSRTRIVSHNHYGAQQIYAQVFGRETSSGPGRFMTNVLLHTTQEGGAIPMFMGQDLQTGYLMPSTVFEASRLEQSITGGATTHAAVSSAADMGFISFQMNRLRHSMYKSGAGITDFNAQRFNSGMRQFGEAISRVHGDAFSGIPGVRGLLEFASRARRNTALVVGMDKWGKDRQYNLMLGLANIHGFDPSSPGRTLLSSEEFNGPKYGTMNLRAGSAIEQMLLPGGAATRSDFPVPSRIEQMSGRESYFVGDATRAAGRGGTVSVGPTMLKQGMDIRPGGISLDLGEGIGGGLNKLMLLDVSGQGHFAQQMEGQGVALHSGQVRMMTPFTKPVLDPHTHSTASSQFLDTLVARVQEGQLTQFTKEELHAFDNYVGMGPSGMQYLRDDPRMTSMMVGYRKHEAYGKTQVHLSGLMERMMDNFKVFGSTLKGTMMHVDQSVLQAHASRWGLDIKGLGFGLEDVAVTTGDMLEKAPGFIAQQMVSAFGVVGGKHDIHSIIESHMPARADVGLHSTRLGRVTTATAHALAHSHASLDEAGMVLAGIYAHGKKFGIEQAAVEQVINHAFGVNAPSVLTAAKRGLTFALSTLVPGSGPGDYGVGRSGMERRHVHMLFERLKLTGMKQEEISNVIGNLLSQKRGLGHHVKTATNLLEMVESISGLRGPISGLSDLNRKTYGLGDLKDISRLSLRELVETNPHGFMLDLTHGAKTKAEREIAAAASSELGQGQIFIPGKELMEGIRQTSIKTAEGTQLIDDQYTKTVEGFIGHMFGASTSSTGTAELASGAIGRFREDIGQLASGAWHSMLQGKVRGSVFGYAMPMNDTIFAGNTARSDLFHRILKRSKGRAVFYDTNQFLTQLNDFMGNSRSTKTVNEAALKAENFFTGLERMAASGKGEFRVRGQLQPLIKNPTMSFAHVPIAEVFRDIREVGQSADPTLSKFLSSRRGGKWSSQVNSWLDVANMNKSQRWGFFKDFARTVNKMAPQGGGTIMMPVDRRKFSIGLTGSNELNIDLGMAGAAIADFDADQWAGVMLNEASGKSLRNAIRRNKGYVSAEMDYKMLSGIFTHEAKEGLRAQGHGVILDEFHQIREDLLKEDFAQSTVGRLDVRMNMMRYAVSQSEGGTPEGRAALGLMKVLQEHTVIKSKKLPKFEPYAEMMNSALDELTAGNVNPMATFLKTKVFQGTKLVEGGIDIPSGPEFESLRAAFPGGKITLDDTLKTLASSAAAISDTGLGKIVSPGRMALAFKGKDRSALETIINSMRGGNSIESAVYLGGTGPSLTNVMAKAASVAENSAGKLARLDKQNMGMLALGAMGSILATSTLMGGGYDAKPMTAPGEYIPPELRSQIAAGSMINQDDSNVSPDSFNQPTDPYSLMGRPLNTPATYINQPNSYQLRGNISSMANINRFNNYMSTVSGGNIHGAITIQDNRMPITPNYTDRLMGYK